MKDREAARAQEPADNAGTAEDTAAAPPENGAGEAGRAGQEPEQEGGAEEKIAALQNELLEVKDQYLRKAADFDNFRKRVTREKQESVDFANQSLILDLLPVIDDLERAIKAAETPAGAAHPAGAAQDFASLYEGISMIEKRLLSQLENRWGLKRFDSAGEPFDPNRHEAIMMDKSADIAEPVVAEDFIKGYSLKDRVIRAAKVKVLMPAELRSAAERGSDSGQTPAAEAGEAGPADGGMAGA